MHLAVSLVIRAEVQIARQTSQLHRIARATSSSAGAFILAAATLTISGLLPARPSKPGPPPPATNSIARIAQPRRLPAQVMPQEAPSSRSPIRPCNSPWVMNIVWPVNRSEPGEIGPGGGRFHPALLGEDVGEAAVDIARHPLGVAADVKMRAVLQPRP